MCNNDSARPECCYGKGTKSGRGGRRPPGTLLRLSGHVGGCPPHDGEANAFKNLCHGLLVSLIHKNGVDRKALAKCIFHYARVRRPDTKDNRAVFLKAILSFEY